MVASDWTMQFLADMLGAPVDRPVVLETTALGAAYLAGCAAGVCPDPEAFARAWALQRRFLPHMDEAERATATRAGRTRCAGPCAAHDQPGNPRPGRPARLRGGPGDGLVAEHHRATSAPSSSTPCRPTRRRSSPP